MTVATSITLDQPAPTPGEPITPGPGQLPPAALALARLIGEALAEQLWQAVLAESDAAPDVNDRLGDP